MLGRQSFLLYINHALKATGQWGRGKAGKYFYFCFFENARFHQIGKVLKWKNFELPAASTNNLPVKI
jgi:hypothetical protein